MTGYNGPPPGLAHCEDEAIGGCVRINRNIPSGERSEICRAIHAEQNCIIQAAIYGVSLKGGTMYITVTPCTTCAKMIIGTKIEKIVFEGDYPDGFGLEMIKESKIEMIRYEHQEESEE